MFNFGGGENRNETGLSKSLKKAEEDRQKKQRKAEEERRRIGEAATKIGANYDPDGTPTSRPKK